MCKQDRLLSEFSANKRSPDGKDYRCKPCDRVRTALYRKKYPERVRASNKRYREENRVLIRKRSKQTNVTYHLKRYYKMTPEDFDKILASQGYACAICGSLGKKWHVDHDHACCPGEKTCGNCIRGVLCYRCNTRVLPILEGPLFGPALAYLAKPNGEQ